MAIHEKRHTWDSEQPFQPIDEIRMVSAVALIERFEQVEALVDRRHRADAEAPDVSWQLPVFRRGTAPEA